MSLKVYSREGYDPEWLALEDAMGFRYRFDGNLEENVPEFNAQFEAIAKLWPPPDQPLDIHDEPVEGSSYQINARVYRPKTSEQLPMIVFFHGGGFVAGNLATDEPQCLKYASDVPCVVVSIEYPLSPTYKIAQITEAACDATTWVSKNASRWNADSSKLLVCGGSAGAFLAQLVAYQFTSIRKDYQTVYGCVLLYTMMGNWTYNGKFADQYRAWDEMGESDVPFYNKQLWDEVSAYWGVDTNSPAHYPLLDPDLSHFPPTYIISAEKDCGRDESLLTKLRLTDHGVRCRSKIYKGFAHWFHAFPQIKAAHSMLAETVEGIRWLLSDSPA